jgi:CDP-diacylglycerol--glycerol-3-phosphate 3-phosphatidyltransferase
MPNLDLACSIAGFSLVGIAALLYVVRVVVYGVAKFDRVEKDKGSALFGASLMQMGYWSLDYIGRALSAMGATANGVSLASLVLGIGAGVALAFGHYGLGALLAVLSALGDTLDGIVARLQGTASDAGEVLDAAVDRYEEFFFLGGIVVHVRQSAVGVSVVLFALLGSFMVSYATAKAEALRAQVPRGAMRRPERAAYLIIGAGLTPILAPFLASHLPAEYAGTGWLLELPALGAVALVALVANVSAVRRLAKLFATVGGPRAAAVVDAVAPAIVPAPIVSPAPPPVVTASEANVARTGARETEALAPIDATR